MSPEFVAKWEHILEDVEKQKIPIEFIKKLVIKLEGKRQQTINIKKFLEQERMEEQEPQKKASGWFVLESLPPDLATIPD